MESRKGIACNLAELSGPSSNPELNGTGITEECLQEIIEIGGTIDVEKIKLDFVVCHEYTQVAPDEDSKGGRSEEPTIDYFFHHMLPFCVSCAGLPDGGGGGGGNGEGEGDGVQRMVSGGY